MYNYNQGPTMTKASEVVQLRDNEKSRLLENFLKKHFFREFEEVSAYFFFVMHHKNYAMHQFILPCASTP